LLFSVQRQSTHARQLNLPNPKTQGLLSRGVGAAPTPGRHK
jgi:hypothetical protein